MGLDIYAGPVSRYVAGDWKTIVQQAGEAAGTPVIVMRQKDPSDRVTDINVVSNAVASWRLGLIRSLGLDEEWEEDAAREYYTDKPDWDGASQSPVRYPTLLMGAEWCLPLVGGPAIFRAPTPNGNPKTTAPFGLSVLMTVADFAAKHKAAWIMDY